MERGAKTQATTIQCESVSFWWCQQKNGGNRALLWHPRGTDSMTTKKNLDNTVRKNAAQKAYI